jgi:hypothetical protein
MGNDLSNLCLSFFFVLVECLNAVPIIVFRSREGTMRSGAFVNSRLYFPASLCFDETKKIINRAFIILSLYSIEIHFIIYIHTTKYDASQYIYTLFKICSRYYKRTSLTTKLGIKSQAQPSSSPSRHPQRRRTAHPTPSWDSAQPPAPPPPFPCLCLSPSLHD